MSQPFKKLEEITLKFMKNSYLSKDLVTNLITIDNIKTYVTKFNKMNLLEQSFRGGNKFKENLIDKNIFNDTNHNATVIASLLNVNHEKISEIIEYLFKKSVIKTKDQFIYKYEKFFDQKLFHLIDNEKYIKILLQVINNKESINKISLNYNISNEEHRSIILELFIFEEDWYIVSYNVNDRKLYIYNSKSIVSFKEKEHIQIGYVDYSKIENGIKDFIKKTLDLKIEEYFYIKAPIEIMNKLIYSQLVDYFEIYEQKLNYVDDDISDNSEDYDPFMLSKMNISINTSNIRKKIPRNYIFLSKIDADEKYLEKIDNYFYTDNYEYDSSRNNNIKNIYIFKIKTNSIKKDFIIKNFSNNIKILENSLIKIV